MAKNKLRCYLVDVENGYAGLDHVEDSLPSFYEKLNCTTIDIVSRTIGGKPYDIICDDEGLLKENPTVSAMDAERKPMLVGNLLICGPADEEGNLTSLTRDDLDHIRKCISFRINARHVGEETLYTIDPLLNKVSYYSPAGKM